MSRNTLSTAERIISVDKSTPSRLKLVTRERALFKDSLLDSSVERKRRTWTTLLSIVLQLFLIGILIVVPLWFTEELPKQQLLTLLEAPPPPPPPPPPPAVSTASTPKSVKVTSNIVEAHLRTPSRIPAKVQMIKEDAAAVPPAGVTEGVIGGVPGGTPGGQLGGVLGGIMSSNVAAVPKLSKPAPEPAPKRVRVSQGVTRGLLISRVEPAYPTVAHEARIQGVVVLTAIIGKDGSVEHLQLASGNPLLVQAAIDAVKQWRYKPFLLNGQPVEIETTITVNFQMHSG